MKGREVDVYGKIPYDSVKYITEEAAKVKSERTHKKGAQMNGRFGLAGEEKKLG